MAGLVPAIHVFASVKQGVDARTKPGMTVWKETMHDIKFIRDNPDAFDSALRRRGLAPEAKRLIELDEKRRAKILELETAQARRNAASKEIGEAKKNKDEEKAKGLLSEVAALKESDAGDGGAGESGFRIGAAMTHWRKSQTCRSTKSPMARTRRTTLSIIASARSANMRSRPSSISSLAKRSTRWILKPRRSSPVRDLLC